MCPGCALEQMSLLVDSLSLGTSAMKDVLEARGSDASGGKDRISKDKQQSAPEPQRRPSKTNVFHVSCALPLFSSR
jgi:hypothetical protein